MRTTGLQTRNVWIYSRYAAAMCGVECELASALALAYRLRDGPWPQWWPHRDVH